MGGKTAIAAGLLAGVIVGGLVVGGLLAFLPGPAVSESTQAPTPPAAATPVPTATPPAAASQGPEASASPSAQAPSSGPAATSPTSTADAFGVGEPAPSLVVPKVGGGTIDLASLKGKPVWINFMATWCPPCVDELPLMAGFAARYADTGLVVIPVDVREDEAAVAAFIKGLGVGLPVGLDKDGAAQSAWGAVALPVHFWIDKDGIVRDGALGGIGPDVMATGLGMILPGVTVTP
jgi:cytochrome c biogenesis protein CcmG, thiol:disulfide interchange protein DsbE